MLNLYCRRPNSSGSFSSFRSLLSLLLISHYSGRWLCSAQFELEPLQLSDDLDVAAALQVGGFMDTSDFQFCYDALNEADRDNNMQVNSAEYVEFARLMSPPGLLDGVTEYNDLPVVMKAAFLGTSCLCQDPTFGGDPNDVQCCLGSNAHIRIPSIPPSDASMPVEDKLYLYAACSYTNSAAEHVLKQQPSAAPVTKAPSPRPVATPSPTSAPVALTPAPTSAPQPQPSSAPVTGAPSSSPVISTPSPTSASTMQATVTYNILVAGGKNRTDDDVFVASYITDLRRAMNGLAPEVVSETFDSARTRRLSGGPRTQPKRNLRRLTVAFEWPSEVGNLVEIGKLQNQSRG